jgi:hypothetical protein
MTEIQPDYKHFLAVAQEKRGLKFLSLRHALSHSVESLLERADLVDDPVRFISAFLAAAQEKIGTRAACSTFTVFTPPGNPMGLVRIRHHTIAMCNP